MNRLVKSTILIGGDSAYDTREREKDQFILATMDDLYVPLAVCCASVLIFYAWRFANSLWILPRRLENSLRRQGLRGNSYRSIDGDAKQTWTMIREAKSRPIGLDDDYKPRVVPFIVKTLEKFGDLSFMWNGRTPAVIITNGDLVKEVLSKNYQYHKPDQVKNALAKLLIQGVVLSEGEKWAKHRRIVSPAFHQEKIRLMTHALFSCCKEVLDSWEERITADQPLELDVWPYVQTLTTDAISRAAFGINYEEGRKIVKLQKEQNMYIFKALQSIHIHIPGWSLMPTKANKRIKEIRKEIHSCVESMIDVRMKMIKEGGGLQQKDLLGMLLESNVQEVEKHGNKRAGMTVEEVVEECKVFYLAGQETTASLIAWALILLGKHSAWQDRAREEVLRVIGEKQPDFDGLSNLKLVTMILYEVARLYPPVSLVSRRTMKESKLGTLTLPAGVQLSLPMMILHHDREIWGDDALEFKPERFKEGVLKAQKRGGGIFFPFGFGPRMCMGQTFAMTEARMALAIILRRFSFELSPSYAHSPQLIFTLQPQHGAHLIFGRL